MCVADQSSLTQQTSPHLPKKNAATKNLSFILVTNNNTVQCTKWLTAATEIFAAQLPKMPHEYISRLVLDRKHKTMLLLKNRTTPIGGICYRPNYKQKFAEIAFCAIDSSQQVKGFGTLLMNKVKEQVKEENMTRILTYADNFALGYFEKQRFTQQVTLAQNRWKGYIQDYDGGTLMECAVDLVDDSNSQCETCGK